MVLQESATKISWSDSLHRQESTISHGSRRPQTMTVVLIREKRRSRQTHKVTKERRKRQKEWAASQSPSAQTFTCRQCSGVCTSRIGLYSHQRACKNWPSTMPNPHLRRTSHHHQQQQRDYKLVNSIHNCIWHIQCYYSLNQLVSNWTGGIPKYIVYLPHTDRYISHSCPTSSVELARWGENGMLLSAMVSWVSSRKVTYALRGSPNQLSKYWWSTFCEATDLHKALWRLQEVVLRTCLRLKYTNHFAHMGKSGDTILHPNR